ncbi:MAG: cytochrome c-type biogenesis CcmF C-terminal domain-containing protein [Aggregatilineales bacterium]|nr:cytochrome c-type biogenesis CcmF C-terminal domain-containing protein [Aggregatilineales bacterium]
MSAELGSIFLLLAFVASVYALIASLIGGKNKNDALVESARNAVVVIWPLLTLAALMLIMFLVNGDYNVSYVWTVIDGGMPIYLRVTALWGSQAGSLLFWSWLMSTFTAAVMLRNWQKERALMPWVIAASMGTLVFFIALVTFWENPFPRYWQTPSGEVVAAMFGPSGVLNGLTGGIATLGERLPGLIGLVFEGIVPFGAPPGSVPLNPAGGQGLNPLLRHPGMIIHPPMLYLGFVSFVVPYAFAMAALVQREKGSSWINTTRRWTLVGWLFLSLGLILGGWWAYDVLGWGGYWAWDPVENAALMPWLTGTAFLHSVMIQEKRGMLRRWNMVLIALTYLQVILGTFATRSGFVSSVHSFAQSAIGPLFLLFLSGALIITVYLLVSRWDDMEADHQLDALLSRETVFLVNNFLFLSINLAVAVGTYWPVVTELLADANLFGVEKSSLGPAYYNSTTGPLWLALILLMGIAPLVAWKRASIKRLGRAVLWPTVIMVVTVVGLGLLIGFDRGGALLGFALAAFTTSVTLLEYHRGAYARVKAQGESYPRALWTLFGRNRRRYGGYMIHLGVIIMAIGVIASNAFQLETQRPLSAGQTITLGDYVLEYENLERFVATDGRSVMRAQTVVYRDGREIARLAPRIDNYPNGQPMSIPGKYSSLLGDDFYVLLVTWEETTLSSATFKVYFNPLVNWVWGGGLVFVIGTAIAAWPDFSEERRLVPSVRRRPAAAVGD